MSDRTVIVTLPLDEQRIVVRSTTIADAAAMAQVRARSWLAAYPNPAHGISHDWIQQYTNSWQSAKAVEQAKENPLTATDTVELEVGFNALPTIDMIRKAGVA